MDEKPLGGRVIVMTGAAHRGSLDLIRALGGAGAALVLWASVPVRSRERRAAAEGITAGARAIRWHDESDLKAAVAEVLSGFGRVDALVHQLSDHLAYGSGPPDSITRLLVAEMRKPGLVVYVQPEGAARPAMVAGAVVRFVPLSAGMAMPRLAGEVRDICVAELCAHEGA